MTRILVAWTAAFILLASAPAMAQDWSQTFHPDSLPPELSEIRVVIATGGPGAVPAGQALRENLRQSGSPMVIDNPVISDVQGLADLDVVERLAHLPVDAVVIVRTFGDETETEAPEEAPAESGPEASAPDAPEATSGAPELAADAADAPAEGADQEPAPAVNAAAAAMAMITFYSLDGAAIAGFMVYPGVALTSEQRRNVGRGISQEAFDATKSALEDARAGEEEKSGRLRLLQGNGRDWKLLDRETGETIMHADIYRRLEREDLAASYEANAQRQARRASLGKVTGSLGLAALAIGSTLAISTYVRQLPSESPAVAGCSDYGHPRVQQNCHSQESFDALSGQRVAGISLLTAGIVGAFTGLAIYYSRRSIELHPLNFPKTRELVKEANAAATREDESGDASPDQALPRADQTDEMSLEFAPYLQSGPDTQGGLQLRGRW
ncbi:hypothetical protein DL240_14470 [Lujinxingia litoralis]|uniref:Uncharacterized protein n=1 Tax=Lujinxingia litoralis TaxID=2211119 RepID=A0A328C2K9_9DELT|nr:hypothetical protein [Lujinxingia litoralis]RAL20885.1 hypothetical protein DL240_14470 [Lujinxingia litoralis]